MAGEMTRLTNQGDDENKLDWTSMEFLGPLGGQLTMGSTLGFCSGVALRFAGKFAAVCVGASFCLLQGMAYQGYIDVNWRKLERDYLKLLDADNDGEVTSSDLGVFAHKALDVLTFNLPASSGFTAGLLYGFGVSSGTSAKAALLTGLGGRLMLARAAAGAASVPAVGVGMHDIFARWSPSGRAASNARVTARSKLVSQPRPGYCMSHFLGGAEERCVWSHDRSMRSPSSS
mmetsp:Transcript_13160/g.30761  ORF Transcript_13160/g.30761 Transcript_13160/m.30761 type:complete len:231 (-) Transcript_13160:227-919(-)|eukprot:CAMPEP_0178427592 /NCGR_PEP_ID=MMETSP0689_2-20121128/29826_1 /TAXON_ID=160604 /ORGANISM="Amphidinium massartii, Strain CS-259" /LENGTH=230 /DNA_ID=CAMNT_0020049307 /DNA_START=17 /DNA_END=709 /DNA_ORIENTATION=+